MDYRVLLKKLERTLEGIETSIGASSMVQKIMESIVQNYGAELGIIGGRCYELADGHYQLVSQAGDSSAPEDFTIPTDYPPIQRMRREGQIFMRSTDPGFDPKIEGPLNISTFTGIAVGESDEYVISFTLQEPIDEEHVHYMLTTIRHVANLRIRTERLETYISEARRIQLSLLPDEFPKFFDFDIYGISKPAEIVGGDVFDVMPITDGIIALAVADASGHGLPAALQVRDVIIGLRMGLEKDMKIVRTIQKLNTVLAGTGKNHEFVTLFYGELEDNGNFFYCNAGHPPPIFLGKKDAEELNRGGLILGPYPKAKYERGYVYFEKGDILVMYTDGVTEANNSEGEEFGAQRLLDVLRKNRACTSRELCRLIFEALARFTGSDSYYKDDSTIFIVKRQ